jgi:hypothetical protein
MAHVGKTYDVFITHSSRDAALAMEVASACRESGLEAVTNTELLPVADSSDALWEALAESRALLTILSPTGPTPSMGIEIGAARAWNKPIYALVTDPSFTRIPAALSGIHLYTTGRLQDVIQEIRSSVQQLTDEDRDFLMRIHAETGISVDQLALQPARLQDLVKKFDMGRGKTIAGERLLSELLRLRKQGKLVKNGSTGRSRPNSESA